jgi:hypothetical protein
MPPVGPVQRTRGHLVSALPIKKGGETRGDVCSLNGLAEFVLMLYHVSVALQVLGHHCVRARRGSTSPCRIALPPCRTENSARRSSHTSKPPTVLARAPFVPESLLGEGCFTKTERSRAAESSIHCQQPQHSRPSQWNGPENTTCNREQRGEGAGTNSCNGGHQLACTVN